MSESELKNALLQKDNLLPADEELKMLHALIESEQRRTRRFALGALAAWTGWATCLALMLLVPVWMARPSVPAGQPPLPVEPPSAVGQFVSAVLSTCVVAGALILPIVGVCLTIFYFIASRSALSRHWITARMSAPASGGR